MTLVKTLMWWRIQIAMKMIDRKIEKLEMALNPDVQKTQRAGNTPRNAAQRTWQDYSRIGYQVTAAVMIGLVLAYGAAGL